MLSPSLSPTSGVQHWCSCRDNWPNTAGVLMELWLGTVSSRPPDSRQRTPHLHTALGHLATWQTCNDTFAWTQTGKLHKYSSVVLFSVYIASGRCGLLHSGLKIVENFCHLNSHFISPTAFMNNKQHWLIDIHWIIYPNKSKISNSSDLYFTLYVTVDI